MHRLSVMILGLSLAATGCARLGLFQRPERAVTLAKGPRVGTPAPDIEGEDFNGQRFKLSDYRGKVVVVSFWASWCKPCRDLIPHEQALVNRLGNRNFVLLGVNMDAEPDDAAKVIARHGITWRNWQTAGDDNAIKKTWPVEVLPTVYVIDTKGIIRYTRISSIHLDNAVETLLAEAETNRR